MATTTVVPKSVITEDHRLETSATKAQEELARLRWHWTLDESNPKRVGFREYARAVKRSNSTIGTMVRGYAAFLAGARDVASIRSLSDEIELAKMGEQKRTATEAIAGAMGTSVSNIAAHHRDRVRDTISAAEDAAERRGTTVEEEIPRVALSHQRTQEMVDRHAAEAKAQPTLRYIEMEGDFGAAKRRLMHALDVARDVDFNSEEITLLQDTIAQLVALLNLIDMRLGGSPDVDWDAEAAKLNEAAS